jgi:CTD small phosphatase-like protein 2
MTDAEKHAMCYKNHMKQTYLAMKIVRNLPQISARRSEITQKMIDLPKPAHKECAKTVIFDLDETLVHCNDNIETSDIVLPVTLPDGSFV